MWIFFRASTTRTRTCWSGPSLHSRTRASRLVRSPRTDLHVVVVVWNSIFWEVSSPFVSLLSPCLWSSRRPLVREILQEATDVSRPLARPSRPLWCSAFAYSSSARLAYRKKKRVLMILSRFDHESLNKHVVLLCLRSPRKKEKYYSRLRIM